MVSRGYPTSGAYIAAVFVLLFVAFVAKRLRVTDGMLVASLTLFVSVGGSLCAGYVYGWSEGRPRPYYEVPFVLTLAFLVLLAAYSLYRSTEDRSKLKERERTLAIAFNTLAADHLTNLGLQFAGPASLERNEQLTRFQKLIEGGERFGGIVDEPSYYLGMTAFYRQDRQSALTKLGEYTRTEKQHRDNQRLARAFHAKASVLRGWASDLAAPETCQKLLEAYSDTRSAIALRGETNYKALQSDIAADIIAKRCQILETSVKEELEKLAAFATRPASIPEPTSYTPIQKEKWTRFSWDGRNHVTTYVFRLQDIPKQAGFESITVEINSSKWEIKHGTWKLPAGANMAQEQEPALRKSEPHYYEFFLPRFDPKLGWYLLVEVATGALGPRRPDFDSRVGYVRFP